MRQIVSTPDTIGGKWRLDGHRISVAQLKDLIRHEETEEPGYIERGYPHLNLTAEERAAIKAWTFPALYDEAELLMPDIELRCRCGEWIMIDEPCPYCGRRYTLTLTEAEADK